MRQVDQGSALQEVEMLRGDLESAAGKCEKRTGGLKGSFAPMQIEGLQLLD